MTNIVETQKIVQLYIELGFKPVPLAKNTKTPFIKDYLQTPATELWLDYNCNVGLQCGVNGLICFDADNSYTHDLLVSLLAPYSPWTVKTRTGTHFWLKTEQKEWVKSYRVMQGVYAGEIRLQNCQTVVPPSFVTAANYTNPELGDWQYKTITGDITTMGYIPVQVVEFIISATCDKTNKTTQQKLATKPVVTDEIETIRNPLLVKMPRIEWTKVKQLVEKVNWLRTANKGDSLTINKKVYQSRSEVFQSVITALVRYGYTEREIGKLAMDEQFVYHDEPYYAIGLALRKTYDYLAKSETIQDLQTLYFNDHNWQYITDKVVYQYLVARCIQFNKYEVRHSKQEIMTHTGIKDYRTINAVINRLELKNLVSLSFGTITVKSVPELPVSNREMCLLTGNLGTLDIDDLHIDLIAEKILGKSTQILNVLTQEKMALGVKELCQMTGLARRSLYNYLNKLQNFGIVEVRNHLYSLVEGWEHIIYELASDTFNDNYLKIQAEYHRWQTIKDNRKIYGQLKEELGHVDALELIKMYEEYQYVNADIVTAINKAGVIKPDFVIKWLNKMNQNIENEVKY